MTMCFQLQGDSDSTNPPLLGLRPGGRGRLRFLLDGGGGGGGGLNRLRLAWSKVAGLASSGFVSLSSIVPMVVCLLPHFAFHFP
jgi:hypothetical protein